MSIQLSEAQLKSAARAATWEQIKVMYKSELEQYASEREKLARIDELKGFITEMVVKHGNQPARSVSTAKLRQRIRELQDK